MKNKLKIFVDGNVGTTGLEIVGRLESRPDIQLLKINPQLRKSKQAKTEVLNEADIAVLCLPDEAATETVALVENSDTKIIDASTAHRLSEGWTYGFPEYQPGHRQILLNSSRISNPGCYAIAAIAILFPLVKLGIVAKDWPVSITGLSGYSGGGKFLIKKFEQQSGNITHYDYGLGLQHKHLPEITKWSHLEHPPSFLPCVGNFFKGMLVRLHLPLWALSSKPKSRDIYDAYKRHYQDEHFIKIADYNFGDLNNAIDPQALNDSNFLQLHLLHDDTTGNSIIIAQLDNLGKGASGQVVQTINLLAGIEEKTGL